MITNHVIAFLFCLSCVAASAQQPSNDHYTNAIPLTGASVEFGGSLAGGSGESWEGYGIWTPTGYTQLPCQPSSVWWTWTAADDTPVTIEVLSYAGGLQKASVDLWTGMPTNGYGPTCIAGTWFNSMNTGRRPFFSFVPAAGQSYNIRVNGSNDLTFTLRLTATRCPRIMIHPVNQTASVGGSTFFGVCAAGPKPLHYQWRHNGTVIPGATKAILPLDTVTLDSAGAYSVTISNASGSVETTSTLNVSLSDVHPLLRVVGKARESLVFGLAGEPGRCYRIESSTNLVNWMEETNIPKSSIYPPRDARNGVVFNTNGTSIFSVPCGSVPKYVRALRYRPCDELCNSRLKQIRFAKEIWGMTELHPPLDVPTELELFAYIDFPLFDSSANLYYEPKAIGYNPACLFNPCHVLEEPEY